MIPSKMHSSWVYPGMSSELDRVNTQLAKDAKVLCPEPTDIFNAFRVPLHEVRVVVLGLSPYPDGKSANGISFAVDSKTKPEEYPYALKSIINSFGSGAEEFFDPSFQLWMNQGFMMLNSALTCAKGQPDSHVFIWNKFTYNVLRHLIKENPDVIIYATGRVAWEITDKLEKEFQVRNVKVFHPSSTYYNGGTWVGNWSTLDDLYKEIWGKPIDFILPF